MPLINLSLAGKIKLFPARESLISDIPAGDGKTANLFYSVYIQINGLVSGSDLNLQPKIPPNFGNNLLINVFTD